MATSPTAREYNRTSFTLDAPQRGQDRASQDFHPSILRSSVARSLRTFPR